MSKVLAQWVPQLLTSDQKLTRLIMSEVNLARIEADQDHFVKRFLTQDKRWVHHFEPETKRQSMQWKHSISPAPKKAKVASSAEKVMASIFWDVKGTVFIDYLQKSKTINGEYYAKLLRGLQQAITRQSDLESWQKVSCFIRTMLLLTNLWLQSPLCMIVALNYWSRSIFSWFGTIGLFSVPKLEKTSCWKTVREWWWYHFRRRGLFWRSGGQIFEVQNYLSSIRLPKKISQSVSRKHEFNAWQVSLETESETCHAGYIIFIVKLQTPS